MCFAWGAKLLYFQALSCIVGFMLIVFAFVIVFVYILVFPELTDGVLCGASWLNLQALC